MRHMFPAVIVALISVQGLIHAELTTKEAGDTPVQINDVVDEVLLYALKDQSSVYYLPDIQWKKTFKIRIWHWKVGRVTLTTDLRGGTAESILSLRRIGDASLSRVGEKLILEVTLGFGQMQIKSPYRAKCRLDEASGTASATLSSNSVRARFSFLYQGGRNCTLGLESLDLIDLGYIKIHASGIGPLKVLWRHIQAEFNDIIRPVVVDYLQKTVADPQARTTCQEWIGAWKERSRHAKKEAAIYNSS